jgi:hypothetical protein
MASERWFGVVCMYAWYFRVSVFKRTTIKAAAPQQKAHLVYRILTVWIVRRRAALNGSRSFTTHPLADLSDQIVVEAM